MGSRCCTGACSRCWEIFQGSRDQTAFVWQSVPNKDSILTVYSLSQGVYICFIWSFVPGGIWLRFEIDWGSSFSSLWTTVLKTCFSMMRGGGASMSRAKTSQPEGLATKYVHLFITWFNWNVAWFCASHVAGSTQWFLYGMLRLNPFDCWSNFLLWLCFVSFFYSYGGFQSRGTCFQLYTGFCWGKISQAQPFLSS